MARTFVAASSQYLEAAGAAIALPTVVTIAAWYRPASLATHHLVGLYKAGSDNESFRLITNGTGAQAFEVAGGVSTFAASTGSYATGAWSHFCAVRASNASRSAYLNGGNKVTNTSVAGAPSGLDTSTIGRRGGLTPGTYADGDIAEAAIWNVALTDQDVAVLAAGVSPLCVRPDALVNYWPILGGYSPEIDVRARFELTVTGATPAAHPRIVLPIGTFGATRFIPHFIVGVTKDSAGAALGACTVKLFRTSDDVEVATTTSDGSGNYSFTVVNTVTTYYVVAYKTGSPDVAGTTVNTLVGV